MSPDDQLSAFLGETPKQSRADLFALEAMKRSERRIFVQGVAVAAGGAAVLALVLWACAPALTAVMAMIASGLAPVASVLMVVAAILVIAAPSAWRRTDFSAS